MRPDVFRKICQQTTDGNRIMGEMANHCRDFKRKTNRASTKNRRKHKSKFIIRTILRFIPAVKVSLILHQSILFLFYQTMEWVSKFSEQIYPIITTQSTQTTSILQDLWNSKLHILPELNKAVNELDSRLKGINSLAQKGKSVTCRN